MTKLNRPQNQISSLDQDVQRLSEEMAARVGATPNHHMLIYSEANDFLRLSHSSLVYALHAHAVLETT